MIKTAIIFVLLILLAGGAFLSRPTKQGFESYVREQAQRSDNPIARFFASRKLDSYIESVNFKDRYLWVEVEQDGKTQFVGVFSRFFAIDDGEKASAATKALGLSKQLAAPQN